jgi:hypothetical protein
LDGFPHEKDAFMSSLPKTTVFCTALNAVHQQSFRLEFRGVTYLIIDENLLLGPQLLRWIDLRCREIFPFSAEKPFGGNVFEEQMELSAENYFASVPKKKKKSKSNIL